MFESLLNNVDSILKRLRGKGRISEENTREAVREIRTALLEADVNYKVAKDFTATVAIRAAGQEVIQSISPGQQFVKIFYDELVNLMGPVSHEIPFEKDRPTVIMLAGLQGSGKTTTAAKLARHLEKMGRHPMLVAADIQRPAAIDQLKMLGKQLNLEVFSEPGRPPRICENAVKYAAQKGLDVVILDTAGRLHVDEELMAELREIADKVKPKQIYFVCDAMTGQDAVNSAAAFNEKLSLDGVILTKLDGDARGGAALSIKAVTGKPIKFVGVGEQLDRLEEFRPEGMASRILGMGDVVSLVTKAQETVDADKAKSLAEKIRKNQLSLDDFLQQLRQVKKMGPIRELMSMIPGLRGVDFGGAEEELPRIEAIICSMTPGERNNPDLVDGSRKRRIASGSGTSPVEVNQLLKQFKQMKKLMKHLSGATGHEKAAMASSGAMPFGVAGGRVQAMRRHRKHRRR
jgi:signal recognition particle subunit SRP54